MDETRLQHCLLDSCAYLPGGGGTDEQEGGCCRQGEAGPAGHAVACYSSAAPAAFVCSFLSLGGRAFRGEWVSEVLPRCKSPAASIQASNGTRTIRSACYACPRGVCIELRWGKG